MRAKTVYLPRKTSNRLSRREQSIVRGILISHLRNRCASDDSGNRFMLNYGAFIHETKYSVINYSDGIVDL